ncbi:MAG: hypothetical protein WCQ53_07810 [bacterium]
MKNLFMFKVLLVGLLGLASCSSNGQNIPASKKADTNVIDFTHKKSKAELVPGEYLAVIKANSDVNGIKKIFAKYGIKEFKSITNEIIKISLEKDPGVEEIKKLALTCDQIKSIEPNRIIRLDDPKL